MINFITDSENELHFGQALRESRLKLGLSQEELALESNLDRTYISMLEREVKNPTLATISKLAKSLGTTPLQLVSRSQQLSGKTWPVEQSPQGNKLVNPPFYGTSISCGKPLAENFEVEKTLSLDEELIRNPADTFFIRSSGDSMSPTIWDNDILIVNVKKKIASGSIVVAKINGDFTVKRFFLTSKGPKLVPDNTFYKELFISDAAEGEILGTVVGIGRSFTAPGKK